MLDDLFDGWIAEKWEKGKGIVEDLGDWIKDYEFTYFICNSFAFLSFYSLLFLVLCDISVLHHLINRFMKNCVSLHYLMCYSLCFPVIFFIVILQLCEILVLHHLIIKSIKIWVNLHTWCVTFSFPLSFSPWIYFNLYEISVFHHLISRPMKFLMNCIIHWGIPSIFLSFALVISPDYIDIWIL